ncbi:MAG: MFS transporter [Bacteroidia bacterium]
MSTKEPDTSKSSIWSVIMASSVGTLIEWYDFYIFGSLALVISTKFFPQDNPAAAFLSTLATFAAGFVVRPFGALFFGRLGDLIGRKYTFMVTLLLMGGSTFLIGCIPDYNSIGFLAPVLVLLLRLLQGLALGGEYGGAATYVAEHAPSKQRGYWTSWIQTTATLGLFVSLTVILITRSALGTEAFDDWGWRVPFLVSILMVIVSYFIRKNMHESPVFAKVKAEGKISKNPLKESFGNRYNFKFVLLALFGAVMGQGVIWYTGQFYAMSFIGKVCGVSSQQTDMLMAIALLLGTPFFIVFGALSDRIGRKKIMMLGMFIAIVSYRPIYNAIYQTVDCSTKSEMTGKTTVEVNAALLPGTPDSLITTRTHKEFSDGTIMDITAKTIRYQDVSKKTLIDEKKSIQLNTNNYWILVMLVFIQIVFVTMVYGPIAAFLVEMFPAKIRYTSMSLPYHIGNGIFGGLLPTVATYLVSTAKTSGNAEWYLQGLWYPIVVGAVCLAIGLLYLNKNDNKIKE